MSQKLPVNSSKWNKIMSQFNEKFIKIFDEDSDKDAYLK